MSENKFIAKLKGEPTPKSVVEIQNDRLVAPFKSSPMGHIADRDSSVVAAKGAQNWAINQGQLVPVADDYIGTESDLTTTSRVSGAGLWLNATYTFPQTGDEKNPVSAIIAPSAKWVLTLCGDSLMTQNGSVITLTMLIKIGGTHLTTKQFKIRECASQFSHRLAIDFSESEQKVIKAHGGSPLTVQVLCDDEGASATIYSGMTHLTLLQRKIDAQRSPCIGGGVARLFGSEMRVLPIGELLGFANLLAKDNREDLLQTEFHNTIFAYHRLQIYTIGRLEVASSAKTSNVVFESQPHFAYVRIGEYLCDFNGQPYMRETK